MFSSALRFPALALVLIAVTGCGGGAGGGSTGSGGNPTAVTFTFKGGTPTAVAARMGSGAFQAETPNSGTLTLSIPSGTNNFAVAYVCSSGSSGGLVQLTEQTVVELTTADGTAFNAPCGTIAPSTSQTGILSGSVDASAIPGATLLNIDAQNGDVILGTFPSGPTANFSFAAPAGSDRVEVLAYNLLLQGYVETPSLVAARTFNGQTVPGVLNGGNTVVLAAGDETTPEPITYNNVPSGFAAPSTLVGFEMNGGNGFIVAGTATTQYPALPAGAVESGDFYSFLATAYSSSTPLEGVSAGMTSSSGGPVSITLPAPWSYAGPKPAALPTFDFAYTGFSGTGFVQTAGVGWLTGSTTENYSIIIATVNFQNGTTTVAFPDLSALTGFPASPPSGTNVTWSAQIVQSNLGVMQATHPSPVRTSTVLNGGVFAVP